ncbi:MAG TPA: sulfatase-like hydrolase/transferase, partial [Clostridiales bacterium]|nr:sulfatase-like hydrolase/transferase [Clostridiales bacterium]
MKRNRENGIEKTKADQTGEKHVNRRENKLLFDREKKVFPLLIFTVGIGLMLAVWITRLNFTAVLAVAYCCVVSLLLCIGLLFRKKLYLWMVLGYGAALFGILSYYIICGADAGFGAFTSGLAGFSSAAHPWLTGPGNFFTRLLGNLLLALPSILVLTLLLLTVIKAGKKPTKQKVISDLLSVGLILTTVVFVLTMNLRSVPHTERLWEGQEDYLKRIDREKTAADSPNVLFVLMDDLGYGDISANGAIYDTPNIDRLAEEGAQFTNFYSSYSVCSPARFAALTGRYPYRGYADNVLYPTVNSVSPFASTRLYNSVEMGANADGMLGDEITIAEVLHSAGYTTGCFGKWHLGDYGEYLPT